MIIADIVIGHGRNWYVGRTAESLGLWYRHDMGQIIIYQIGRTRVIRRIRCVT